MKPETEEEKIYRLIQMVKLPKCMENTPPMSHPSKLMRFTRKGLIHVEEETKDEPNEP